MKRLSIVGFVLMGASTLTAFITKQTNKEALANDRPGTCLATQNGGSFTNTCRLDLGATASCMTSAGATNTANGTSAADADCSYNQI